MTRCANLSVGGETHTYKHGVIISIPQIIVVVFV
jgi:hypothetical protein